MESRLKQVAEKIEKPEEGKHEKEESEPVIVIEEEMKTERDEIVGITQELGEEVKRLAQMLKNRTA